MQNQALRSHFDKILLPALLKHRRKMTKMSFLDFQHILAKRRISPKLSRLFSFRDRQNSGLLPTYQPNWDEMRRVFDKFDSNKDGKICQQEYKVILRAIGEESTVAEVPKIFQVADLDGDGFINFKEFVEVLKKEGGVKIMEIQSAFRTFDLNGDGKISADDVLFVLRRLGERCNQEDCMRMVRAVDTDGDDLVDMNDFMTMMAQTMKLG